MRNVLNFATGMLFNVLMGVIIASVLGVSPAYGAASGVIIPMVAGGFMPQGSLFAGVYKEIWTGELVKQLNAGLTATFLDGIPDYSSKVDNEVIHLVDVGGNPDVLINNTTYPIPIQNLDEDDIPIGLDKFQTKATRVTDDQLLAISFDKFATDVQRHADAINEIRLKKAAHALAPYSNTATTPVIKTSGEADSTGRRKITRKDIIALKRAFDKASVPTAGRRLVLCSDHINDLLEDDQKFKDQYYNYQSGKVINLYGFEVQEFVNCPYFTKAGVKVDYKTAPAATDLQASFAFYVQRMFGAKGSTKMYYRSAEQSPETQESLVNFRHYEIYLPKKQEAIGAIYSWDGQTEQTSNATTPTAQYWYQVRRAAQETAAAGGGEQTGGDELEEA